jgi:class 3 adenylate cyclase
MEHQEPALGFTEEHDAAARDPVNPTELEGAARDDYLALVWEMFSRRAVRGRVNVEDAEYVAACVPVEGVTIEALDKHMKGHDELTFEEVVAVIDAICRAQAEDYMEIDLEQKGLNEEVALPPLAYLRTKLPCVGNPPDVRYRLEDGWSLNDLTPKTRLVLTTALLMALIGAALLVIIYVLWSNSNREREAQQFSTLRTIMSNLVNRFEFFFFRDHFSQLVDQTHLVAQMADRFFTHDRDILMVQNQRSATRVAVLLGHDLAPQPTSAVVEVAAQIAALGAQFNATALAALLTATGTAAILPLTTNSTITEAQQTAECSSLQSTGHTNAFVKSAAMCVSDTPGAAAAPITPSELVALLPSDSSGTAVQLLTASTLPAACYDALDVPLCDKLVAELAQVRRNSTLAWGGVDQLWGASSMNISTPGSSSHVVVGTDEETFLDKMQLLFAAEVNYLNFAFVRTTEAVVGRFDKATGVFDSQITLFRFEDGCFQACFRLLPSRRNADLAFLTQGTADSITPDYRPEPVLGAAEYMHMMKTVFLLERDVVEVRGLGLQSLIEIVDNINLEMKNSAEVQVFRHVDQPPMKTFDPAVPCTSEEDCITLPPPIGVYFKYNCIHCQRHTRPVRADPVEFLNKHLRNVAAADFITDPIYAAVLDQQSDLEGSFVDYAGHEVDGMAFFAANYSLGCMVKIDSAYMRSLWWTSPFQAIMICCGVLILGLCMVVFSTSQSLSSMERDWLFSKKEIEAEKAHFAQIVADLVPPNLSQRMLKGQKFVAETANNVTMVFADLCAFSERIEGIPAKHTIRLAGYCMHVMQVVADAALMLRMTSIGDLFIAYGHTKDEYAEHSSVRGCRFAMMTTMLSSSLVEHWPERLRVFRDAFKERKNAVLPFALPRVRFGAHFGTLVSGVLETGTAPRFDGYGALPSLSARMCATSQPDRLHMTASMKDAVAAHDADHTFVFGDARKTIVRGTGAVTSYFLKATTQELPTAVLDQLAVQHARLNTRFGAMAMLDVDGSRSSRSRLTQSNASTTDQTRSAMSKKGSSVANSEVSGHTSEFMDAKM